jgi:hypothetical protein
MRRKRKKSRMCKNGAAGAVITLLLPPGVDRPGQGMTLRPGESEPRRQSERNGHMLNAAGFCIAGNGFNTRFRHVFFPSG